MTSSYYEETRLVCLLHQFVFEMAESEDVIIEAVLEGKAWTFEEVLKLVAEVRARPCLWDTNHPSYGDKQARLDMLNEISLILPRNICEIKSKWRDLYCFMNGFKRGDESGMEKFGVSLEPSCSTAESGSLPALERCGTQIDCGEQWRKRRLDHKENSYSHGLVGRMFPMMTKPLRDDKQVFMDCVALKYRKLSGIKERKFKKKLEQIMAIYSDNEDDFDEDTEEEDEEMDASVPKKEVVESRKYEGCP